jgi:hypothetical protein
LFKTSSNHPVTKGKIISISFLILMVSCKTTYNRQDLFYRSFLADKGLYNPIVLMEAVKHDKIKAIHYGYPGDTIIRNFLLFNKKGDLLSINSSQKSSNDLRFLEQFFYDKHNRLVKIIPKSGYFGFWEPDSLIITYKKATPINISAYKEKVLFGVIELKFSRNYCQFIEYHNDNSYESMDILDYYYFEKNRIMYEIHQKFGKTSFVRYTYKDGRLLEDFSPVDDLKIITKYDSLNRPIRRIEKENGIRGKVLWLNEFRYYHEDKFPTEIITTAPDSSLSGSYYLIDKY